MNSNQTEKDIKIQNSLKNAGGGLPIFEAMFLKYGFPILKKAVSWDMAMKLFLSEGQKIVELTKDLDSEKMFKKVLISKVFAIEDNSRYYSPAMVLWHLTFVGEHIKNGIIELSKGQKIDITVKIEEYKPFVEIDSDVFEKYSLFLENFKESLESRIGNISLENRHRHPWLGDLNPKEWLVMSAIHQIIHRRQLEKIVGK